MIFGNNEPLKSGWVNIYDDIPARRYGLVWDTREAAILCSQPKLAYRIKVTLK